EVLAIELEWRRRRGDRPEPLEYLSRFPEHAAYIDAVFVGEQTPLSDETSCGTIQWDEGVPMDSTLGPEPSDPISTRSDKTEADRAGGMGTEAAPQATQLDFNRAGDGGASGRGAGPTSSPVGETMSRAEPSPPMSLPVLPAIPGYEIVGVLGRGGMG